VNRLLRLVPVAVLTAALLPLAVPPAAAAVSPLAFASEYTTPAFPQYRNGPAPELFASATAGDIDGDSAIDVVAGYQNGHIYAWHAGGGRFLDITTPGSGSVRSTPVLVDLNKDGKLDILASNQAGYVFAYDGAGHRIFNVHTTAYHGLNAVFAAPVAADVTGDGILEIIAVGWDHYLWVWDLAGHNKRGFPLFMADTMWASPAVADLNADGRRDIVFAYDCVGGSGSRCQGLSRTGGGFVTALDGTTAKPLRGWPHFVAGQTIWSSPAISDINGDGKPDVVVGTGLFNPSPAGAQVNAFDAQGRVLPGWPMRTRYRVFASPSIGDVNGDGKPEISVMDEKNYLYLYDGAGHALPGWPICGTNNGTCNSAAHASTVMADVTGDGIADVIAAGQTTVRAFDRAGHVLSSVKSPLGIAGTSGAPTVTEIGGKASVLLSTTHRQNNGDLTGTVVRFSSDAALGPAPWPIFRQNVRGTSHLDDLVIPSTAVLTASALSSTVVQVSMTASDAESGVAVFDAWFRDNGGPLFHWLPGAAPTSRSGISATHTRTFGAKSGHTYRIQARARDRDGNYGHWGLVTVTTP
jgi:hypothetical protein